MNLHGSLILADNIIVTDIYAAREKDPGDITSKTIIDKINALGKEAKYLPKFDDIVSYIKENAKENDIVLTLGAGTVTNIGNMILE